MSDKPKVELREWTLEDAPALAAIMNNKKLRETLTDIAPFPYTEKDARDFISGVLSSEDGSQYTFAITYEGETIGNISVVRGKDVFRLSSTMGYYVAQSLWGKGIMTEALRLMCDYIFEQTDLIRIEACAFSNNPASCKVLEKAGFQFEGTIRQGVIKNGQILDSQMYSLIRLDWES